jgi:glycosyltransferase involved in cell wall biosynthesis
VRSFVTWCRARRIAIVHTSQLYPHIFGLPAAALARVPVRISNRRSLYAGKTFLQLAAQRAAQHFSHRIVANSAAAAARLRAEGVPADRIAVVPNGVDVSAFPMAARGSAPHRVVVVANLRRVKGHDVLIRAAPHILRRFPAATFHVVGDGPLRDDLRALAAACGVASAFTFLGHQEDVADRLAESGVFVLPSRSESTPNALLEAMAAGLPVVASDVGGVGEMVEEGRTGLLFAAGNSQALADRACQLMAAPALAASLGQAARAEVTARFSFERMVGAFEGIYEAALAANARSG